MLNNMGQYKKIFVIAEAGTNHNGSIKTAKMLIAKANEANADAIKFQFFYTENIIRVSARKAAHWENIKKEDSVFKAMKKLEFKKEEYACLRNIARDNDIMFFASVFDFDSLFLAKDLNLPVIKIPSGEITNLELLRLASGFGRPIILSTGMSNIFEVERAVSIILKNLRLDRSLNGKLINKYPFFEKGLILMHTVSAYPSLLKELNLNVINTLKSTFGLPVGYSDHSIGDEACLTAVALGAELIERHFTLNKEMKGFDHKASVEPAELKNLIIKINNVKEMLGDGIKRPSAGEKMAIFLFRKSISAKSSIKRGEIIKRSMLETKRPLDGIGCDRMNEVLGLKTGKGIKEGDSLKWNDLILNEKK